MLQALFACMFEMYTVIILIYVKYCMLKEYINFRHTFYIDSLECDKEYVLKTHLIHVLVVVAALLLCLTMTCSIDWSSSAYTASFFTGFFSTSRNGNYTYTLLVECRYMYCHLTASIHSARCSDVHRAGTCCY